MLPQGTRKKSESLLVRLGIVIVVAGGIIMAFSENLLRSVGEQQRMKQMKSSSRREGKTFRDFQQLRFGNHTKQEDFLAEMSRLERKLSNESVVWPTLFLLGAAKAASSTFHVRSVCNLRPVYGMSGPNIAHGVSRIC